MSCIWARGLWLHRTPELELTRSDSRTPGLENPVVHTTWPSGEFMLMFLTLAQAPPCRLAGSALLGKLSLCGLLGLFMTEQAGDPLLKHMWGRLTLNLFIGGTLPVKNLGLFLVPVWPLQVVIRLHLRAHMSALPV